jgi:hypothetical protein
MTYKNLLNKVTTEELNKFFLSELNIIKEEIVFVEIDIYPDFDISEYEKGIDKTYFFKNDWKFKTNYDSIITAEIISTEAFEIDTVRENKENLELATEDDNGKSLLEIIKDTFLIDKDSFSDLSLGSWDAFELKPVNIIKIDNVERTLTYNGSYFGDPNYVEMAGFDIISQIQVHGYKKNHEFFKQLIAESQILLAEKKYKLSFFLVYSSLENFINVELRSEEEEARLEEKLKRLCKQNFGELNSNKIYSSLIDKFKDFTITRNTIAHGNDDIDISKELLFDFLNFTLFMIYINTNKISSFSDVYDKYTNANIAYT